MAKLKLSLQMTKDAPLEENQSQTFILNFFPFKYNNMTLMQLRFSEYVNATGQSRAQNKFICMGIGLKLMVT